MPGRTKTFVLLIAALWLSGCSTYSLQKLRQITPAGTPFQNALARLYMDFATTEEKEYDWPDSWHFADKGLMLAYGKDMPPEELADWNIPQEVLPLMEKARASLMAVMTPENMQSRPEDMARAQYFFDCWVEQQEENWQLDDIAYCRDGLQTALTSLNAPPVDFSRATTPQMEAQASVEKLDSLATPVPEAMKQERAPEENVPPASAPLLTVEPMPVPEAVMKKPAAPIPTGNAVAATPETVSYVVFFDYNSAELSASGAKVVDDVAAQLASMSDYEVVINGYTDTSGSPEYNLKLSNQRVDAVKQGLVERGVKDNAIKTFAYGKSDPKFKLGNGVKEAANRRVEIFLN